MPVYVGGANMVLKGTAVKMRQSSNSSATLISTGESACFPLAEDVKAYSEGHCGKR